MSVFQLFTTGDDISELSELARPWDRSLITNFDDLLIKTQELYDKAKGTFSGFMLAIFGKDALENLGLRPNQVVPRFDEMDREAFKTHGVKPIRFPTTMVTMYDDLCKKLGIVPDDRIRERSFNIGNWVFTANAKLYPGVEESLHRIRSGGYRIVMLTAGIDEVQNFRIDRSGLRPVFEDIKIVPKKTPDDFAGLVRTHGFNPDTVVSIGDKFTTDIVPSVDAGIKNSVIVPSKAWRPELEKPEFLARYEGRYQVMPTFAAAIDNILRTENRPMKVKA
jgi:FMN phosphatase YigB (HAD superfamily)